MKPLKPKENHIVFDFDCTLTKEHWWKGIYHGEFSSNAHLVDQLNLGEIYILKNYNNFNSGIRLYQIPEFENIPNLINYMWGGRKRLENVRKFLNELSENDIKIHISTNGQVNEVIKLLKQSHIPLSVFTYIHGFNDSRSAKLMYDMKEEKYTQFDTCEKVEFIKYVYKNHTIDEYAYIDDDSCEYANARQMCKTINLKKESGGMTNNYFVFIKELFKMEVINCK